MGEKVDSGLPEGWSFAEDEADQLPPGWSFEEENPRGEAFRDKIGEELERAGYDNVNMDELFSEDLERAADLGVAEATKGFLSGGTFGLTEWVPGLKTHDTLASTAGKVMGSIPGLSKIQGFFTGQALKLAAKSPIFQRQAGAFMNLVGAGLTGATSEALEKGIKLEVPSGDDLLRHGASWALLDGGLRLLGAGGAFAKSLLGLSKKTGTLQQDLLNDVIEEVVESGVDMSRPDRVGAKALEVIERMKAEAEAVEPTLRKVEIPRAELSAEEKVAQEALKQPEVTPESLENKTFSDQTKKRIEEMPYVVVEPKSPTSIDYSKESAKLEDAALEKNIDAVGKRALSSEELGESIQKEVDTALEKTEREYKPLYSQAKKAAGKIVHTAETTAKNAGNKLIELERLETRPSDYVNIINRLESTLKDLGYKVQRHKNGKIDKILKTSDTLVSDQIELAQRLNSTINYESVDPTVKNYLKTIVRDLKADIKKGLSKNSDALAKFELAEEAHGAAAGKFRTKAVKALRISEKPENIVKNIDSPSVFSNLKEVMSPKQFKQVEREVLEKMREQSYEKARKTYRELKKHMSEDAKKAAEDIIGIKNPHNPAVRDKLAKQGILEDLSNAFSTGKRPSKTLDMWGTKKGRQLVEEAFKGSKNWKEVKSYLEKQSFNDMLTSVMDKSGRIDPTKLKQMMKNSLTVKDIRAQGGEEAVEFFEKMSAKIEQLEKSKSFFDRVPSKEEIDRMRRFASSEKGTLGKEKLEKAAERRFPKEKKTQEVAKEAGVVSKKAKEGPKKIPKSERGENILKRMVEKDFPTQAKFKEWGQWFKETIGIRPEGFMTVFGLMKLGIPNSVSLLVGYRLMNKMLTSQSMRKAFTDMANHSSDPIKFVIGIDRVLSLMDEKEEK